MTPAIAKCYVDESGGYPTHRPLCIEVLTRLLEVNVKELQRPTHFANMLEQRIEAELDATAKKKRTESRRATKHSKENKSMPSGKETGKSFTKRLMINSKEGNTG